MLVILRITKIKLFYLRNENYNVVYDNNIINKYGRIQKMVLKWTKYNIKKRQISQYILFTSLFASFIALDCQYKYDDKNNKRWKW